MTNTVSAINASVAAKAAVIRVEDQYIIIDEQLKAIEAILDAARVLTALERAPAHHDTHPSHEILTGGGYAHGYRVKSETLPDLMGHARTLVQLTRNDAACAREEVIDALQKVGYSDGG